MTHRRMVEQIKLAHTIKVTIDEGYGQQLTLNFNGQRPIKRLAHEIAIAIQSYFVENDEEEPNQLQSRYPDKPYHQKRYPYAKSR